MKAPTAWRTIIRIGILTILVTFALRSAAEAQESEKARDEKLAHSIGVQACICGYPMMDCNQTLWETSFDAQRGHDRALNQFFVSDRLITSCDDWRVTPNADTIYLRAFMDLRAEPMILATPPTGDRRYRFPVSEMQHDIDANLSWDTGSARSGAFAFCPTGWQGVLPEGVKRIDIGPQIIWTLSRFTVSGAADLPGAVALQQQSQLVPDSQRARPRLAAPIRSGREPQHIVFLLQIRLPPSKNS